MLEIVCCLYFSSDGYLCSLGQTHAAYGCVHPGVCVLCVLSVCVGVGWGGGLQLGGTLSSNIPLVNNLAMNFKLCNINHSPALSQFGYAPMGSSGGI